MREALPSVLVVAALVAGGGPARADVVFERGPPPPAAEIVEGPAARSLPPGVTVEGVVVARASFVDVDGEHVVVVTETAVKETPPTDELDDGAKEKHLFGWHFVRATKKKAKDAPPPSWKRLWQTKDWVKDCPFDLYVDYVEGSLEVTDLDGDGRFETLFAYRTTCTSDVSPFTLKLLLHEGEAKYAVRGTTRIQTGVDEKTGAPVFLGGELTPDPAFTRAPPSFLAHAKMRFSSFQTANPW